MAGLRDISLIRETVDVYGTAVDVTGVSAEGIAYLINRFPELRMVMSGKKVEPARWMELGGKIVAAVIAAGTGAPGNPEDEAQAALLPVGLQIEFIEKIAKLTMPDGPGPFVERVMALQGGVALSNTAPATKSQRVSKR